MSRKIKEAKSRFETQGYTNLFASGSIDLTYIEQELNLIPTISCELVPIRARWTREVIGHPQETEVVCADISDKATFEKLVKLHLAKGNVGVKASPVCRDFTLANNKRDPNSKRANLYKHVLEFVRRTSPVWVVIENSDQMMKVKVDGKIVGMKIVDALKAMGYYVDYGVQDCAGFFTPQHRRRTIIIAHKYKQCHLPTPSNKIITLRKAIGHLPVLECGQKSNIKWHDASMFTWTASQIAVMAHTPSGKSAHDNPYPWLPLTAAGLLSKARFKCSFQRKDPDDASNTLLQDRKSISGFRNCHYGNLVGYDSKGLPLYDNCRPLTILEIYIVTGIDPDENGDLPIPAWTSDNLIRQMIGECWAPRHCLEVMRSVAR